MRWTSETGQWESLGSKFTIRRKVVQIELTAESFHRTMPR